MFPFDDVTPNWKIKIEKELSSRTLTQKTLLPKSDRNLMDLPKDKHFHGFLCFFVFYRNQDFEDKVREAAIDLHLQAEEASPAAQNNFVLKVVQLKEIFDVRHSVFIIGNAGTGS
jgi:hypothetical protein